MVYLNLPVLFFNLSHNILCVQIDFFPFLIIWNDFVLLFPFQVIWFLVKNATNWVYKFFENYYQKIVQIFVNKKKLSHKMSAINWHKYKSSSLLFSHQKSKSYFANTHRVHFCYPSSHSRWKTMLSLISRNTLIFRMLNQLWTSNCTFSPFLFFFSLAACRTIREHQFHCSTSTKKAIVCDWVSVFCPCMHRNSNPFEFFALFCEMLNFQPGTLWHKSTLKNTRSAKHCSHKVKHWSI